jgi:hypothetical protein
MLLSTDIETISGQMPEPALVDTCRHLERHPAQRIPEVVQAAEREGAL